MRNYRTSADGLANRRVRPEARVQDGLYERAGSARKRSLVASCSTAPGSRCWGPSAWVAHRLDHLADRCDDQLRLVLVDVVPALGSDGVMRTGDELGEILLQRGHDPFHLVAWPARRRCGKWDAVGQNDERHRAQRRVRSRLAYLTGGGVVRQRGGIPPLRFRVRVQ